MDIEEELSKMTPSKRAIVIALAKAELPNLRRRALTAQTVQKQTEYRQQVARNEFIALFKP